MQPRNLPDLVVVLGDTVPVDVLEVPLVWVKAQEGQDTVEFLLGVIDHVVVIHDAEVLWRVGKALGQGDIGCLEVRDKGRGAQEPLEVIRLRHPDKGRCTVGDVTDGCHNLGWLPQDLGHGTHYRDGGPSPRLIHDDAVLAFIGDDGLEMPDDPCLASRLHGRVAFPCKDDSPENVDQPTSRRHTHVKMLVENRRQYRGSGARKTRQEKQLAHADLMALALWLCRLMAIQSVADPTCTGEE